MSIKNINNNEIKKNFNNQNNIFIFIKLYINFKIIILNIMIYIINKIFNNKKIIIYYYKKINDIIHKINSIINNKKQKNKEIINNNKINKKNKIIINKIILVEIYILYYLIISLMKIKSYYEINLTIKGNGTQQIIFYNKNRYNCGNKNIIIDKPDKFILIIYFIMILIIILLII